MDDRHIAVVTGANKGIGFATAKALTLERYRVWLACRDKSRGEEAVASLRDAGGDAHFVPMDVDSRQSVESAYTVLARREQRIDLLINNAGIAPNFGIRPSVESIDSVKAVYETNVFGPIRVTQALLPLLAKSASPRIIMISGRLGSLALAADPSSPYFTLNQLGYNTSKTALNAVMLAFAKDLASQGVRVCAVDPGYTATDLTGHKGVRDVDEGAAAIVAAAREQGLAGSGTFYDDRGSVPW